MKDRMISHLSSLRVPAIVVLAIALFPARSPEGAQGGRLDHWVGTWATVPVARCPGRPAGQGPQGKAFGPCDSPGQAPASQSAPAAPGAGSQNRPVPPALAPLPVLNNQTMRQIVRTSLGGDRVRVVLTNVYGTAPLAIGAAHVGLREKDAAIKGGSSRALTFSGNPAITIPPGSVMVSDPVALTVSPLAELAIDVYLPGNAAETSSPLTVHAGTGSLQTNYISPPGNHAAAATMPVKETTLAWLFLARVEVTAPQGVGAIVTLGDSITDGSQSTANTNNRWPDHLARRLAGQNIRMGVLNAGFSGNRILEDGTAVSALARFDRDVLAQTGATHVIVLEGINDIGMAREKPSPSAADIIAGHRQLIERARAQGLKVYGATLTPFEGAFYWSPEGEAKRKTVNEWIRTSKAYDGVIDFDAAVRDPDNPTKVLPKFDPGDHLHANDAGYEAMANAINLDLFRAARERTSTRQ
jgi:lysophospholipase L1-like esterase